MNQLRPFHLKSEPPQLTLSASICLLDQRKTPTEHSSTHNTTPTPTCKIVHVKKAVHFKLVEAMNLAYVCVHVNTSYTSY